MKILLTTLNSKYVHSNLALKYLYTAVADTVRDIEIREFTINNELNYIFSEIMRADCDIVCFSCYVWNIEMISKLGRSLKLAKPELRICLGGPEVSFDSHIFMRENTWVDFIIRGEGEEAFKEFCSVMADGSKKEGLITVPGLVYRETGKIYVNPVSEPMDLNDVPFPYSILECESDKVIYYESSRGCPFGCTYCLSSADKSVRVLDMDRVKADIGYFLRKNVMQVKFVDRTFNYDAGRAYEIIKYIIDNDNGYTNFHFEVCADLLDDRTIELLTTARSGLFQLEAGIQSINPDTLKAVNRSEYIYPVLYNLERLIAAGNLHIHVDLIAGLPLESYKLFERSFNKVYALGADMLQMGFLKVLKGTPMAENAGDYGIVFRPYPPYEVISTGEITADEMVKLKTIEKMLDIYYNRGGFRQVMKHLTSIADAEQGGAFGVYERLGEFYCARGYQNRDRKKEDQYRILRKFILSSGSDSEALRLLDCDMKETMNEDTYRRFFSKGWEI